MAFSGIDQKTNPEDLQTLYQKYPFVEFAFLLSENSKAGNRYPRPVILKAYKKLGLPMAVHLCGKIAIEFIHTNDWKPVHDLLGDSWDLFDRIQINIPNTKHFSRNLIFPEDKKIIIQLHAGTEDFYHHYQHLPNVQGFQDSSGGKGISGCNWMEPQCDFFGYADGINPDMMPFFMTGLIFQKFSQKSDNLHPVLCVVFIIIGYLLGVYANSTVNYYCSIYGNIAVFYLSAFVSIAGYVYISNRLQSSFEAIRNSE